MENRTRVTWNREKTTVSQKVPAGQVCVRQREGNINQKQTCMKISVLAGFCYVDRKSSHLGRGSFSRRIASTRLAHGEGLWDISLISDWCWGVQPTVDSAVPGQVVLGSIRKQVWSRLGEQADSAVFLSSSVVPTSIPLESLLWFPMKMDCDLNTQAEINLLFPSYQCFITEQRSKLGQFHNPITFIL